MVNWGRSAYLWAMSGSQEQSAVPVAVTIGSFDGVHRGHVALVEAARAAVGSEGTVVAMPFYPHPMSVLRPEVAPLRLTTLHQRSAYLHEAGVDEVAPLEPSPQILGKTAEDFVGWVVEHYRPSVWVEGPDFRFGRGRGGDIDALARFGEEYGFRVMVVGDVDAELSDQSVVRASSTMVRWLLEQGRVEDAAAVLGRAYEIRGTVRQGDQRGRLLGYPTANVQTECMLPRDGVYAGEVTLPDGRVRAAAVHIGPRATFDRMNRTLEVFVIDWDGPVAEGHAEYGWDIAVRLTQWLRDQAKYDSAADLCVQMARDVRRAGDRFLRFAEGATK